MRVLFDVQRAYHFQAAYRKLHKTGFRVWLLCCVAVLFCSVYSFAVCICDSIVQNHKRKKNARYADVCKNVKKSC